MTYEDLRQLLRQNRSTRIFDESRRIESSRLESLVDLTRYCASGRNLQPLRYRVVTSADECHAVYPALKWAGYYEDWDGPEPGQRPAAYLIQCIDTSLAETCLCDDGLQLEAITLGAAALGMRACIIKAFNVHAVAEALSLPADMKPLYVVALGYGAEKVMLTDIHTGDAYHTAGDIRYYRMPDGTHCVPKRPLEDLLIPSR